MAPDLRAARQYRGQDDIGAAQRFGAIELAITLAG